MNPTIKADRRPKIGKETNWIPENLSQQRMKRLLMSNKFLIEKVMRIRIETEIEIRKRKTNENSREEEKDMRLIR